MPGSSGKPKKRQYGEIETLLSGSPRVRVYACLDALGGKRNYLVETVPAGSKAAAEAKRFAAGSWTRSTSAGTLARRPRSTSSLRLGLSQPSTSALLARLRRHFDDELLARVGNSYELTPLAVTLRERSAAAIDIVVVRPGHHRPDVQPGRLRLRDHGLRRPAAAAAPRTGTGAQLHLPELGIATRAPDFDAVLRTVDGAVFPHGYISGYPSANLYRDEWVVIAAADNTAISAEPTLQELVAAPWLVTRHRPAAFSAPFHRLSAFGVEPRIDGAVDNF